MTTQQTITPERQMQASQVGAVFNSLHEYLRSLEPKQIDPASGESRPLLTKQLEFAHARVDEAAMWAIKSVLTFGVPAPAQAAPAEQPIAPPAPAEQPTAPATAPATAPDTIAPPSDTQTGGTPTPEQPAAPIEYDAGSHPLVSDHVSVDG